MNFDKHSDKYIVSGGIWGIGVSLISSKCNYEGFLEEVT